ncbi:MAG: condensation domain-containing protein, partial [Pseudonocardiaceae bacterium]
MVTELFGHYFSIVFDEPVALTPPRTTMRDAVALELEALGRRENYEFWSDYLQDATLMQLPRLNSGPTADKGAREIVRIPAQVSKELSDALKRLATANAVPLKSVLLAAHMAVMNHYHGLHDTLTYTVTNGRPESADGSTAIGLFVNSLALRVKMSGGTWRDLIDATLASERQSMPYRRLPMAELKRHQGNEPLAETLFFFTDYHVFRELDRWRAKGVDHVTSELYGESTFPFCAIHRMNRDTGALEIRIEYDSLQFPAQLMHDMAETYTRVLQTMVADPDARYDSGSLLSDEERHRLLVEWNDSGPALRDAERIHDLVWRWAARTPDAIAVSDGTTSVSYAALRRMARRVAGRLVELGAGPERTVAVLAERSVE